MTAGPHRKVESDGNGRTRTTRRGRPLRGTNLEPPGRPGGQVGQRGERSTPSPTGATSESSARPREERQEGNGTVATRSGHRTRFEPSKGGTRGSIRTRPDSGRRRLFGAGGERRRSTRSQPREPQTRRRLQHVGGRQRSKPSRWNSTTRTEGAERPGSLTAEARGERRLLANVETRSETSGNRGHERAASGTGRCRRHPGEGPNKKDGSTRRGRSRPPAAMSG